LAGVIGAGRPDARRHQRHFRADDAANFCRLLGRADDAVDADVARLRGALSDQLRHGEVIAGGGEIGVVIGR
jgi:hypothetical protein